MSQGWAPWIQPVLTSNTDYGVVSATSINEAAGSQPYKAVDGIRTGSATSWESVKTVIPASWKWVLPHVIRISEITLYNKYSGSTNVTRDVQVFADEGMTIPMSSLAQEESRSISENVTWGQRKRFSDGKVSIPYGQFLGYRKGADGLPEIVPEEAEIVRKIYRLFMLGKSTSAVATQLTAEGVPTPGGKTQWQRATVESILTNEKYKGSALLQKSFTVDFLTKKKKVNEGEVPQYYVEESHPAIINPDEWQAVQVELDNRKRCSKRHRQTSVFSGKIFCGDCGEIYGSKVWHSTSKYRRVIWQCNAKFDGEQRCGTPHLYEEQIRQLFVNAMSEYLSDREGTISNLRYAQKVLTDTDFIDEDIRTVKRDQELITELIRVCINGNASNTITEEEYHAKHSELCARFEQTEEKLNRLQQQRERMQNDAIAIGGMLFELTELDSLPITFNESLWNAAIDRVTVYADERVVFHFKDGKDIEELL